MVPPLDRQGVARRVSRAASPLASRGRPATLGLLLCPDREIAALNASWLGRRGPTNVISFTSPMMDAATSASGPISPTAGALDRIVGKGASRFHLGDVAVSVDTALAEAGPSGRDDRIVYLALHGLLHVLGWDHEDDASWKRMHQATLALVRGARR